MDVTHVNDMDGIKSTCVHSRAISARFAANYGSTSRAERDDGAVGPELREQDVDCVADQRHLPDTVGAPQKR